MKRKVKFWLLLLLGICIFIPIFLLSIMVQVWQGTLSVYGVMFSLPYLAGFGIYCWFLYSFVYKRAKPKYPVVPPEGRSDIYFPRTNIPRPIHSDVQRYPKFFKVKKKAKRWEKTKRKK